MKYFTVFEVKIRDFGSTDTICDFEYAVAGHVGHTYICMYCMCDSRC